MDNKNRKVAVKSTVKAQIGIFLPYLNLKREWLKKGALQYISFEDLQQAIYDPGTEYMFKTGILYIENMQDKIDLGLELEGAVKPTNIIVLTDAEKEKYLKTATISEFKEILSKLSNEQLQSMADYAIELGITDLERCDPLKEVTNIDIAQIVLDNNQEKMINQNAQKTTEPAKPQNQLKW